MPEKCSFPTGDYRAMGMGRVLFSAALQARPVIGEVREHGRRSIDLIIRDLLGSLQARKCGRPLPLSEAFY